MAVPYGPLPQAISVLKSADLEQPEIEGCPVSDISNINARGESRVSSGTRVAFSGTRPHSQCGNHPVNR